MTARDGRRFQVRFGDAPVQPIAVSVPNTPDELTRRAMLLLEELRNADFMPEEFHEEHRALAKAWSRHGPR